jgi:hypothetical protein
MCVMIDSGPTAAALPVHAFSYKQFFARFGIFFAVPQQGPMTHDDA